MTKGKPSFYACLFVEEDFDGLKIGGQHFDSFEKAVDTFKQSISKFKGFEYDVYQMSKTQKFSEPNSIYCVFDKDLNLVIAE